MLSNLIKDQKMPLKTSEHAKFVLMHMYTFKGMIAENNDFRCTITLFEFSVSTCSATR